MSTWERVKAVKVTACTEKATSFAATGIICIKWYWTNVNFRPAQYNFDTTTVVFYLLSKHIVSSMHLWPLLFLVIYNSKQYQQYIDSQVSVTVNKPLKILGSKKCYSAPGCKKSYSTPTIFFCCNIQIYVCIHTIMFILTHNNKKST
jgi:hypothetical protein